jgi:hypothetical protein
MPLSHKRLEDIQKGDLDGLITNQVRERRSIEYKRELPKEMDAAKKEFLADVSSFANAAGGYIVYGIAAKDGLPTEFTPIADEPDPVKLRLDSMIRDGIEPRIPGVRVHEVPINQQGYAFVIGVPRSWSLPHMVKYKGTSRFYSRTSAGRWQLDVTELRSLFALSETAAERIRQFRAERLASIAAGETPAPVSEGLKVVVHLVPLGTFQAAVWFDVASLEEGRADLRPLYGGTSSQRHNLDGLVSYNQASYLQVFRNGSMEGVAQFGSERSGERRSVPSISLEQGLIREVPRLLSVLQQLGVQPPVVLLLSVLHARGYAITEKDPPVWASAENYRIDRDSLLLPEIVLESFECDAEAALRPAFDAIWNASGWQRCMHYDGNGHWDPRRRYGRP